MPIQVTIDDTRNITLDDLISLVPDSKAANQVNEIKKERDRLLTLAVKWCDINHHDWDEISKMDGMVNVTLYPRQCGKTKHIDANNADEGKSIRPSLPKDDA